MTRTFKSVICGLQEVVDRLGLQKTGTTVRKCEAYSCPPIGWSVQSESDAGLAVLETHNTRQVALGMKVLQNSFFREAKPVVAIAVLDDNVLAVGVLDVKGGGQPAPRLSDEDDLAIGVLLPTQIYVPRGDEARIVGLRPSNSVVPQQVIGRRIIMGVDVGCEEIHVCPRCLGRGKDTRWIGVEDLVPLRLDEEDVEPGAIRASLVVAVGVGDSLSTASAIGLRLCLHDRLNAMMRNSLVDTVRALVVLKNVDVVHTQEVRCIRNIREEATGEVDRCRRVMVDEREVPQSFAADILTLPVRVFLLVVERLCSL